MLHCLMNMVDLCVGVYGIFIYYVIDELGDRLAEVIGEEEEEQTWSGQFVR